MTTRPRRTVILDASFVRGEQADASHLIMLARAGCTLVMIDSLSYELCTSHLRNKSNSSSREKTLPWIPAQMKLMKVTESIEVWRHTGELLEEEIREGNAINTPVDASATQATLRWFRSKQVHVPKNIDELAVEACKQRDIESKMALLSDCEALKTRCVQLGEQIHGKANSEVADICNRFVNYPQNIRDTLVRNHGNRETPDTFIENAAVVIDEDWTAYHHAKACLALLCLYVKKYGTKTSPEKWKDVENTKTDTDYLVSLAFADAIAAEEIEGDMAPLLYWMYGNSKKIITRMKLKTLSVAHSTIAESAFFAWQQRGGGHGDDLRDWFMAERELCDQIWDRL